MRGLQIGLKAKPVPDVARSLDCWYFGRMTEKLSLAARFERSLALFVGLAAIVAASVSLYQAALAREQARASAWPYLLVAASLSEGKPFALSLANRGIGPARIRTVSVTVDDKPVATWSDAIHTLSDSASGQYEYSYVGRGSVMSAGSVDTLLTIPPGTRAFQFWKQSMTRLSVSICYCSVYDECWITGKNSLEAEAVKQCPIPSSPVFTQ